MVGHLLRSKLNAHFPSNVLYGDIVKGLPENENSCDGVYCSHVLEHLSLNDFNTALANTLRMLKPGGIFRLVMPDLEYMIKGYMQNKKAGMDEASVRFIRDTGMGIEQRTRGLKGAIMHGWGNSNHLWLWDQSATLLALTKAGFKNIRACSFSDSKDRMFDYVEEKERFLNALAFEMIK